MPDNGDRYAWENPGVETVGEGVFRIPLPLPNDALHAVNVYAVTEGETLGLVDAGWDQPASLDALRLGLAEIGAELPDIATILATHFHRDHYSLAVQLQRSVGCVTKIGRGEGVNLDALISGRRAWESYLPMMVRAGAPAELCAVRFGERERPDAYALPSQWLDDGDRPAIGGRILEAVATPGHTRGHFCFADDDDGLFFGGDHVLPHITPSIGFETIPTHLPLGDYLDSLRRVRMRPDAVLLPAHGPVAPSVHARVDELLAHHESRLSQCGDAVAAGCSSGYAVATRLRWTRREHALAELIPFDQILAVQETVSHLEVLVVQQRLSAADDGGVRRYVVR